MINDARISLETFVFLSSSAGACDVVDQRVERPRVMFVTPPSSLSRLSAALAVVGDACTWTLTCRPDNGSVEFPRTSKILVISAFMSGMSPV